MQEGLDLVRKSIHRERIETLLSIPDYGTYHESNCHGTSLYVLYLIAKPKYYSPKIMEKRISKEDFFTEPIYEGCLVSFWTKNDRLHHTGVYLGDIEDKEIIFHQLNYRGKMKLNTIQDYLEWTIPNIELYFHDINKKW